MIRYDDKINTELLLDALEKDYIGRNDFLLYFLEKIDKSDRNRLIALDGSWGSGKTVFVKQLSMILNETNINSKVENKDYKDRIINFINKNNLELKNNYLPIYFDAWKYDSDIYPLRNLIYEISCQTKNKYNGNFEELKKILDDLFSYFGKGLRPIDFIENVKDIFTNKDETSAISFHEKFESYLDEVIKERCDKLVIFIDELDRCNPRYAVSLLEEVKHYVDDDRVIFVFSLNLEQLQYTIEHYYGTGFDSYRYLDKMFHENNILPEPDYDKYYSNLIDKNDVIYKIYGYLFDRYRVSLREQNKIILNFKNSNAFKTINKKVPLLSEYEVGRYFTLVYIVPIMAVLHTTNINDYNRFKSGQYKELFVDLMKQDYALSYFKVFVNVKTDQNNKIDEESLNNVLDFIYSNIFIKTKDRYLDESKCVIGKMNISPLLKDYVIKMSSF